MSTAVPGTLGQDYVERLQQALSDEHPNTRVTIRGVTRSFDPFEWTFVLAGCLREWHIKDIQEAAARRIPFRLKSRGEEEIRHETWRAMLVPSSDGATEEETIDVWAGQFIPAIRRRARRASLWKLAGSVLAALAAGGGWMLLG